MYDGTAFHTTFGCVLDYVSSLCPPPPYSAAAAVLRRVVRPRKQGEQVEAVLQEINVKEKPSSVGKLYEWITQHPGPEPAATAALAVKVVSRNERRESLVHSSF